MAGHLAGKNIAVTGAGNGIGRAIALACAGEGANVVVADYGVSIEGSDPSSEVADAVVAEIAAAGGTAIAVAGDVSQMEVGQRIVDTAVENWGTIDGVACVAGIVRERMLFNMSEEEFDHVVAVHLKGHFTLYKAASAVMRKQETGGSLVGFTSGAFVASTAQANYSAAKGGIVSLTRSAAFALRRYGVNANCIAPAAMTRMSENVPFEIEAGGPEAIAPLAVFLMSNAARDITAQIYTCTGKRIAVWNQPAELRHMLATDGEMFTVDEVAEKLPADIGVEEMPMFADLERRMKEMAEKKAAEESGAAS
ncbi:MAG: SDR family oxidoreductase [Acidimicrobiales bacterium]|jgi:NAD(P)-dependent dehydrogenase (short-subunit alcohol dehydrogenase family)|nr:SDR family oxidoreductase [Acidimicrobiales bacterium]MCH2429669.1 SDR family oxidoreductase [Acidimicrobiales bacterium]|tara:strand:+ start:5311 stop:6237 length:927 start_codon:yes stop_codon:yes gene_type:complete